MWTLPLHSSPTEYQINSFCDSFRKGFPHIPRWQSQQHGGKKHSNSKTQPRTSCCPKPSFNNHRKSWNTKAEAWRSSWFRAGFTGWTMPKPAPHSKPELCHSLGMNPQQQFAASLLLLTLKSVSIKVSGLFRHPSAGKYLPSRGTRNTDVAFVNSALKNGSSNSSFSSVLLCFCSPDSLWWCCSPFLYGGHPAAWQLQSFPRITHAVTLPQSCRPAPNQRALVFPAASYLWLLWCLFICSSKATGIGYHNYFWLNPFQRYWNVWDISTLYALYAYLCEMTPMHTHTQIFPKQTHSFPPNKTPKYPTDILFHLLRLPLKAIHNTLW